MNIYIPEPLTILIAVLSFLLGFLYKKYCNKEDISDAFEEGFEKGADATLMAVSKLTGRDIVDELQGKILGRRSTR